LFQTSSASLTMLREAQINLGRTREAQRLNLRVTPSFGVRWLGPRLSAFLSSHPEYGLSVDAAPDPTDFEREIMDLDIRYGAGHWGGYHARAVVRDHVLPLCSPDYLAHLPQTASSAGQLDEARLIDSARALCQWDFWLLHNRIETRSNRRSILMDRSSMALQLALDSAGIVLESLALAAGEVADGRLVPVTPALPVLSFPAYWVTCPARNLNQRAVRTFLDWLQTQTDEHEESIAGIVAHHGLTVEEIEIDAPLSLNRT
jgi:LysR family glycine cleavage system transcriptional activator